MQSVGGGRWAKILINRTLPGKKRNEENNNNKKSTKEKVGVFFKR